MSWNAVHRDPRAELLCTAREDHTDFVTVGHQDSNGPALLELLELGLIEIYSKVRWDLPDDTRVVLGSREAAAAIRNEINWDLERETMRFGFQITELGERAAAAEAFHIGPDGKMTVWPPA